MMSGSEINEESRREPSGRGTASRAAEELTRRLKRVKANENQGEATCMALKIERPAALGEGGCREWEKGRVVVEA